MVDRLNTLFVRAWLTAKDGIRREEGQALTEYALVLAVVVVGLVAVAMTPLRTGITNKITSLVTSISSSN
jgi:Flp pilus assembly pilin Flp